MNKHLTEQQLIDYQFKLAEEAGLNAARTHLAECEECRQRLQKLVRKFASLDLLRDEVEVPEDLLSKTVEHATRARPSRVFWLYRVPALGAVAAAVVAGVALLIVSNSRQDRQPMPTAMHDMPAQNAAPAPSSEEGYALRKDEAMSLVAERLQKAELAPESKALSFDARQTLAGSGAAGRVGLAPPEPSSAPGGSVKAGGPVRSVPVRASPETPYGLRR